MTDIRDQIDLDEYSQLMADLEKEIREYGTQRDSLQAIVSTLQAMDITISKMTRRVESWIGTGELVLDQLNELDLPKQITGLQSRYDEHQQSLSDVSGKTQQIVQEQQRASLETLQNAQHTREMLDRIASQAERASVAHDDKIGSVSDHIGTLSTQLSNLDGTLSTVLGTHTANLADLQRQLAATRRIATFTLLLLLVLVALIIFTVV